MIRIAVIGPESTGKSTLCKALATYFEQEYIPEFARKFLNNLNRPYNYLDLKTIAERQYSMIESSAKIKGAKLLIADTEVLTIKIWSEVKYGKCDEIVSELFQQQRFDLYLLCNIDIAWQPDPLRETPDFEEREKILQKFKNELESDALHYRIVSGKKETRVKNAIFFIEEHFKEIV